MSSLRTLQLLCKRIGIGPTYLLVPVSIAVVSAIFEGLSTGLLVPLLKGLIEGEFSFLKELPFAATFLDYLSIDLNANPLRTFSVVLALVLVTSFCKISLGYISDIAFSYRMYKFGHKMRAYLFERLLSFGKQFFDEQRQGELHHILLNFTLEIVHQMMRLHMLLKWVFMLVAYLILMLLISWELTLAVMLVGPIYYFSISKLIKRIGSVSGDFATADTALGNAFFNVMGALSLVKVRSQQREEVRKFSEKSKHSSKLAYDMDKRVKLVYPLQEVITLGLITFLVVVIASMVIGNPTRDVSGFLVYIFLLKRSSTAFSAVGDFRALFASLAGLFSKIDLFLRDEGKFIVKGGEENFEALSEGIEFKNLNFSYNNDKAILNNISFNIPVGKVTAIVGPSGSGKTTIVNLLLRFYDCPKGAIFLDGKDLKDFSLDSLRSKLAYVSQDTQLFNTTLHDNITYGVGEVDQEKLRHTLVQARLAEYVDSLPQGLDTVVGDRGMQLSGGEKQRVAIARAILRSPQILILDEATSALDAETEQLVQSALDELVDGKTVIIIAHRFSTLRNADQIVTISNGKVVESGPLDTLVQGNGVFAKLWKAQELFY